MKKYLLICSLLMNCLAHSTEIKFAEFKADEVYDHSSTFNFNSELGRAWVETNIQDHYNDPEASHFGTTYRFIVKGLSYDNTKKEVIYTNAKNVVSVCVAPVSKKYNPKKFVMKETKNCTFVTKKIKRQVDDGYYVQEVEYLELYLQIKE
jgi:hypothetical protein